MRCVVLRLRMIRTTVGAWQWTVALNPRSRYSWQWCVLDVDYCCRQETDVRFNGLSRYAWRRDTFTGDSSSPADRQTDEWPAELPWTRPCRADMTALKLSHSLAATKNRMLLGGYVTSLATCDQYVDVSTTGLWRVRWRNDDESVLLHSSHSAYHSYLLETCCWCRLIGLQWQSIPFFLNSAADKSSNHEILRSTDHLPRSHIWRRKQIIYDLWRI